MDKHSRLLIIGPAWVGDMVMSQSLLRAVKSAHPQCAITMLAPAATAPIAERMAEVTEVITTPFQHGRLDLSSRFRIGRSLRGHGFEQAIVLPGSTKAALIPFFAGIPKRTGYAGEPRWGLLNDIRPRPQGKNDRMVERYVRLGQDPDAFSVDHLLEPQLKTDTRHAVQVLERLGYAKPAGPILALAPGAEYGPAKRWPIKHFAALSDHYAALGWTIWIMGGPKDRAIGDDIAKECQSKQPIINMAGRTTLLEAVDLLAISHAVVSNDSGLMHVAAATQRPVVGIFGSSSESHTPPLGKKTSAVSLAMDCRPCFARECPLTHTNCLNQLSPKQVIESLERLV
ncbi:MAG: lipopolysaccharide heptosyltransferase II [Gammaproteobacteria bacterium]